jgi:uncharacterized cupredoxin-like copper-binding protein
MLRLPSHERRADVRESFPLDWVFQLALAAVLCAAGVAAIGCDDEEDGLTRTIDLSISEYAIDTESSPLPHGDTELKATHVGAEAHDLVVLRTELAPDALPTTADDTVDQEAEGLEVVGTFGEIEPGEVVSLTLDLEAGTYVIICNVPTHYEQGMRAAIALE